MPALAHCACHRLRALTTLTALLVAVPAVADPAMWVVKTATTEVTLFGTVHELPAATGWLSPAIMARFDAADSVVFETILPENLAALGSLLQILGTDAKLKPLADRIDPPHRAVLIKTADDFKLPLTGLAHMRTWLAALTLSSLATERQGLSQADGVEATLTVRAKAARKPAIGLETPGQQLGYFASLPESDQLALLDVVLDELPTDAADTKALLTSWQGGHPEEIAADKDLKATPALEKALLTDRNARWATWIEGALKRPGKVFVAVGAAHLSGDNSVLAMLAKQGVIAERVR